MPNFLQQQTPSAGKYNFTVREAANASGVRVVEIQLRDRAFYVKKTTGGVPYDSKVNGSPMVSWGQSASMDDAWSKTVAKLGGWDMPPANAE